MSADNWTTCPACAATIEMKIAIRKKAALDSYGSVSPEQFVKNMHNAESIPKPELTLREDYEIGIRGAGTLFIDYSCGCQCCGFHHEFKHEEKVNFNVAK